MVKLLPKWWLYHGFTMGFTTSPLFTMGIHTLKQHGNPEALIAQFWRLMCECIYPTNSNDLSSWRARLLAPYLFLPILCIYPIYPSIYPRTYICTRIIHDVPFPSIYLSIYLYIYIISYYMYCIYINILYMYIYIYYIL